jgi:hypothetical protein
VLGRRDAGSRGKGEVGGERETDERVPLARDREDEWEWCGLAGPRLMHGLGRRVRCKGRFRPRLKVNTLQIVLEFRFKLEFEFEFYSNSNFTQLNSKKIQNKSNSHIFTIIL